MIRRTTLCLLFPALMLSACNSPASVAVPGATGPATPSPTVPDGLNGGTYEVTFQGVGSANPTVGVQSLGAHSLGAQGLVSAPEAFTFTRVAVSTFAVDATQTRHVQATFRVTNNTAQTLLGLKFVPVSTTQDSGSSVTPTVGNTPFKNVRLFDSSDASDKAASLTPTQGQIFDTATGTARRDFSASPYRTGLNVRGLNPDKPSGLTISSIKTYGWEVAPTLAPGASANVTFAVDVPMDPTGSSKDPFSFSLVFVPARENVTLRSAVQQYDPFTRKYGNYTRFPVLNSRSLPAYYDLQSDAAAVLCSFDSALKVQNISSGAFPNRYRVEVHGLRDHDLLVFPGTACPAGTGTPVLTQTVTGVPLRPRTEPIAAGDYHSLALKVDGTVQAWGYNRDGELGNGTTTNSSTPIAVPGLTDVVGLQAGGRHSLALKADGTVQAWGFNGGGQLGNGTTTNSSTPVAVPGLTDVVSLQAGYFYSLALKADGTVQAWGLNGAGQLGNGTTTSSNTPVTVPGLTDVVSLQAGNDHSLALKADGTVQAWGLNGAGQLGNGTTTNSNTPVAVPGLTDVVGLHAGNNHSLALKADGTVQAWGFNTNGELGNGTTTSSNTPVAVSGLTDVVSLQAGNNHSLALKADGTVQAWGFNGAGQLGNGTTPYSPTPVAVPGLTDVVSLRAGARHNLVLKADGTVQAWGYNSDGQLGNGTTTISTTPVAVSISGVAQPAP